MFIHSTKQELIIVCVASCPCYHQVYVNKHFALNRTEFKAATTFLGTE